MVLTLVRVGWPSKEKGTTMQPTRARPRGRMSLQPIMITIIIILFLVMAVVVMQVILLWFYKIQRYQIILSIYLKNLVSGWNLEEVSIFKSVMQPLIM